MSEKNPQSKPVWVDPDDAPELTDEWFRSAEIWGGNRLIRPSEAPKDGVTIWLGPDVLTYFRATGPGWQSRINEALRKAAGLSPTLSSSGH